MKHPLRDCLNLYYTDFAQRPCCEFYACGYGRGVQRINYVVYGYLCCENRGDKGFSSGRPRIGKYLEVNHILSIDRRADEGGGCNW